MKPSGAAQTKKGQISFSAAKGFQREDLARSQKRDGAEGWGPAFLVALSSTGH